MIRVKKRRLMEVVDFRQKVPVAKLPRSGFVHLDLAKSPSIT